MRDYVLVGDGWVKDGNFNTTFSQTVLPLPAHDIKTIARRPAAWKTTPSTSATGGIGDSIRHVTSRRAACMISCCPFARGIEIPR